MSGTAIAVKARTPKSAAGATAPIAVNGINSTVKTVANPANNIAFLVASPRPCIAYSTPTKAMSGTAIAVKARTPNNAFPTEPPILLTTNNAPDIASIKADNAIALPMVDSIGKLESI